ncbi:MAG: rod shape-determining protein MreD [Thermostichales cyanobacterium BF4_bins_65]
MTLGQRLLTWVGTVVSAVVCVLAPWWRWPGTELLGITPDWPLMWVVCWSLRRSPWQGTVAGLGVGMLQDGLSAAEPTHMVSLAVVGFLTARLQKQRYMQEDFVSIALIIFGMVVIAETLRALQWSLMALFLAQWDLEALGFAGDALPDISTIWHNHQRVALSSAILSSLWGPALHLPLKTWWAREQAADGVE